MEYLFGLAVLTGLYFIWNALRQIYENISLLNANFIKNSVAIQVNMERIKEAVYEINEGITEIRGEEVSKNKALLSKSSLRVAPESNEHR